MHRVVEVMHRLRNAGNTLVVVEHDPQVMVAADRVIDIGPGPANAAAASSRRHACRAARRAHADRRLSRQPPARRGATPHAGRGQYAAPDPGRRQRPQPEERLGRAAAGPAGLRDRRVRFGQIDAGAGRALPRPAQAEGQADRGPGAFQRLLGAEQIADVVMVDQTPSARPPAPTRPAMLAPSTRAFAQAPLARERGYTAGTFSFNGDGRCPTCGGTGFEHVEMQFLSDVYLRCPDCDGKRFRPEVLEVRVEHLGKSASIDEVLEMTVSEALDSSRACATCRPAGAAGRRGPGIRAPGPARADTVRRRGAAPEAGRPPGRGRAAASPPPRSPRRAACSCSTNPPPACTSTTWRG